MRFSILRLLVAIAILAAMFGTYRNYRELVGDGVFDVIDVSQFDYSIPAQSRTPKMMHVARCTDGRRTRFINLPTPPTLRAGDSFRFSTSNDADAVQVSTLVWVEMLERGDVEP